MKAGFIGTGSMGCPLADNILRQEGSLAIYDIDPEAARRLTDKQARLMESPQAVAAESDVVFACLPSTDSFHAVWTFVRRLYYLSSTYLSNSPLDALPCAGMLKQFLPNDFDLNKFMHDNCEQAAKDPEIAAANVLKMVKETMKKTGMSEQKIMNMAKLYISTNLPKDAQESLAPILNTVSSTVFEKLKEDETGSTEST